MPLSDKLLKNYEMCAHSESKAPVSQPVNTKCQRVTQYGGKLMVFFYWYGSIFFLKKLKGRTFDERQKTKQKEFPEHDSNSRLTNAIPCRYAVKRV